ncbi:MAG: 30S ribosomal protein S17e [Nanoarchaeota archaeon]
MGRIKTKLVKRTAKELIDLYRDKFSNDFNLNKEIVKELAEIPSKKLRNVTAGYISRLVKKQQQK